MPVPNVLKPLIFAVSSALMLASCGDEEAIRDYLPKNGRGRSDAGSMREGCESLISGDLNVEGDRNMMPLVVQVAVTLLALLVILTEGGAAAPRFWRGKLCTPLPVAFLSLDYRGGSVDLRCMKR